MNSPNQPGTDYSKKLYELEQAKLRAKAQAAKSSLTFLKRLLIGIVVFVVGGSFLMLLLFHR